MSQILYTNFLFGASQSAQQMLVEDGKVVARGEAIAAGQDAHVRDLGGKIVLPKFVDAHCHILPMGLDLQKPNLSKFSDRSSIYDYLRQCLADVSAGRWLHAVQLDPTKFSDGLPPTRDELDKLSDQVPILLRYSNGHASVANSAALRLANIEESQQDPPGGTYCRDESGRLNGVLLEDAHEEVTRQIPNPTCEEMVEAILAADQLMASLGIGTASDMMTGRFNLEDELIAYQLAAARGQVRYRLYVQWRELFGPRAIDQGRFKELSEEIDQDRCRVAGVKIFADGAIGSATAAIYGQYSSAEAKGPKISRGGKATSQFTDRETSGQLIYSPERLKQMVLTGSEAGFQVATHCIGDYATDLVLDAYEATANPTRHRLEHSMLLSDDQIERIARTGCFLTFQPTFLFHFGHAYLRQLGPERAAMLKRSRTVLDAGIPLSFNSDSPIVPPDPWIGIRAAVNRQTPYSPSENVTLEEALLAYTGAGADVNEDRGQYGRLEPGEVAEFQVLDRLPVF